MNREYNQFGDVILSKEEQKLMNQYRNSYEKGWDLETNDPQDEVETEDFLNTYLIHFKKKRQLDIQKQKRKLFLQAEERNKNFIQKLFEKNKYKK